MQSAEIETDDVSDSQPPAAIWSGVFLTVISWFLCRFVVGAASGSARNPLTFNPSQWTHWDSSNYLTIAVHGRTFGQCGSPGFPAAGIIRLDHLHWCGTAEWLPGYPWMIQALHATGLTDPDAGLLLSWSAIAVAMFLIWLGWGRDLPPGRGLVLLLLFGLFPGSVYNFALFPTSVALACIVGAILSGVRKRFFTAALLMTIAGLCYPSAWFAALGFAVGLVILAIPCGPGVIARRALWGIASLSALLVLALYDQITFNHFDAYLLETQQGLSPGFPGQGFLVLVFEQNTFVQKLLGRFSAAVLVFQALDACLLAGAGAVQAVIHWRRKSSAGAQLYPAMVAIAVTMALVFESTVGAWDRSIVLAAPCVVCLRRAPLPLLCALVTVIGITTAVISRSFFINTLV